jgi:hypothetical protein
METENNQYIRPLIILKIKHCTLKKEKSYSILRTTEMDFKNK